MSKWRVLTVCVAVVTAVPTDFNGPINHGVQIEGVHTGKYNPDTENQYHLFTRLNPQLSQVIQENHDALLRTSNYDHSKRTVVLIHGSWTSILSPFNSVMIPAILGAADVNIIAVDWSAGSDWGLNSVESEFPNLYKIPSSDIEMVIMGPHGKHKLSNKKRIMKIGSPSHKLRGKSVARVLRWIFLVTGVNNLENVHIIGYHSGAHQAGIVGKQFGGEIGYITGLDPEFTWWYPDAMQPSDAIYTEVIHTNAGELGFEQPLGHVDFYPNGGVKQPGCNTNECSSHRSFYFMAESLSTTGFLAWKCNSLQQALDQKCSGLSKLDMGGLLPKTGLQGIFFLKTNAGPPFAQDREDLNEK